MRLPSTAEGQHDLSFLDNAVPIEDANPFVAASGDGHWFVNDSGMQSYTRVRFRGRNGGLLELLEEQIGRSPSNVGMDLAGGSQGQAMRDLLDAGILGEGLVTNLEDLRTKRALAHTALSHIRGDLATKAVWHKIIDWQTQHAPDGLALVMHRPIGALQEQPKNVYLGAANLLLSMLRPGGMLFSQIPRPLASNPEASRNAYRSLHSRADVSQIIPGKGFAMRTFVAIKKASAPQHA